MRRVPGQALLFLVLVSLSCRPGGTPRPPAVDGETAMGYVREVVRLGPRVSGGDGAERAARFLRDKAEALGWTVSIDEWREATDHGDVTFRNVHAVLPGRGQDFTLLASHYDTKHLPEVPAFRGANDSGSSTGLLLAIMEILAESPPKGTVECLFFDGEEARHSYSPGDGLHGSRRHVKTLMRQDRLVRCKAMVLMDMVGDRDLTIEFPASSSPKLVQKAFRIAERQGTRDSFSFRLGHDILDDHTPFAKQGVRCINFIDFNYGPDNAYWHTAKDTLDKLDEDSLETTGNVVLALVYDLAGGPR